MVSGPNDIPELKIQAPIVPPVQRRPVEPVRKPEAEATRKLVQAPDTVQLSPRAQAASKLSSAVQAAPEVRPERVQEAAAKLRGQTSDSATLNARLAEKLLTEN